MRESSRLSSFYVVTLYHPDGPEWAKHVAEHVAYLEQKIKEGQIIASGQVVGQPLRAGMYIATVDSREKVKKLIADDPFTPAGIIKSFEIVEWKPFFGAFSNMVEPPPKISKHKL